MDGMRVRFWGVRGSIAVSGPQFIRTGGNTSCVEVEAAGERLILDGGTGLRALGDGLMAGAARSAGAPVRTTILFSHVHWDHIQGVPFFAPAFHPDTELCFVGVQRPGAGGIRSALAAQMRPPNFPITLDMLRARVRFCDILPDQPVEIGPFRVLPLDIPHPDGASAFRIEAGGRSFVYATDIEHGASLRSEVLRLAEGADLLVHDAQYTRAEYRGEAVDGRAGFPRVGWGHSSWEEAVEVAAAASAGRLALFHHDPRRGDAEVERLEALASQAAPARCRVQAAREGAVFAL